MASWPLIFCAVHGISAPKLSAVACRKFKQQLSPSIREIAALTNPIDLTGSAIDDDFVTAGRHTEQRPQH